MQSYSSWRRTQFWSAPNQWPMCSRPVGRMPEKTRSRVRVGALAGAAGTLARITLASDTPFGAVTRRRPPVARQHADHARAPCPRDALPVAAARRRELRKPLGGPLAAVLLMRVAVHFALLVVQRRGDQDLRCQRERLVERALAVRVA